MTEGHLRQPKLLGLRPEPTTACHLYGLIKSRINSVQRELSNVFA